MNRTTMMENENYNTWTEPQQVSWIGPRQASWTGDNFYNLRRQHRFYIPQLSGEGAVRLNRPGT